MVPCEGLVTENRLKWHITNALKRNWNLLRTASDALLSNMKALERKIPRCPLAFPMELMATTLEV